MKWDGRAFHAGRGVLTAVLGLSLVAAFPVGAESSDFSQTQQNPGSPVKVTVSSPGAIRPGDTFEVRFAAGIEPGWHIYGLNLSPDLGIATQVKLEDIGPFQRHGRVSEPPPHRRVDPTLGGQLLEHDGDVTFRVSLAAPDSLSGGRHTLKFAFLYQACNAEMCLPPVTHVFDVPLRVRATGWEESPNVASLKQTRAKPGAPLAVTGYGASGIEKGTTFALRFEASIEAGWHIYGLRLKRDLGIPTALTLVDGGPFRAAGAIVEPEPHPRWDRVLGGTLLEHSGTVTFFLPLRVPEEIDVGWHPVDVEFEYQVCNAEMCLPPATLSFTLPVGVGVVFQKTVLERWAANANPVAPIQVSGFGAHVAGGGVTTELRFVATIDPGWHIFGLPDGARGDGGNGTGPLGYLPTAITITDAGPFRAGAVREPEPKRYEDELLGGVTPQHQGKVTFTQAIEIPDTVQPGTYEVGVQFFCQACNATTCEDFALDFRLPVVVGEGDLGTEAASADPGLVRSLPPLEVEFHGRLDQDRLRPGDRVTAHFEGRVIADGSHIPAIQVDRGERLGGLWEVVVASILGALIALLTPCVYPMIPITISVFTKHSHARGSAVIGLAVIFCLGIIVTFTGIGLVLSLALGEEGANWFASHWLVNLIIGALFIYFAFSLFGYYDIRLPTWLTQRVSSAGAGGGVASVVVMGFVFSVTTFTCVGPIVGSLLALAVSQGAAIYSTIGMVAFSATFSLPFFFLALFPKALSSLPKSGGWLNSVKVLLGFLEFAAAWKFLAVVPLVLGLNLLPREVVLGIWVVTFGATAVYLLGKIRFPHDSRLDRVGGVRVALSIFALLIAAYCAYGLTGRTLNRHLDAQLAPSLYKHQGLHAEDAAEWLVFDSDTGLDLRREIASAATLGKPIFVNFTGFN